MIRRNLDGPANRADRKGRPSWPTCSSHGTCFVYRHALDIDGEALAFGSTTGNAYASKDGGESWACIGNNLPPVYSVRCGA